MTPWALDPPNKVAPCHHTSNPTCPGDIDVLIVLHDEALSGAAVMMQLLARLVHDCFLLDEMDWRKKLVDNKKSPSQTFHGICRMQGGPARRIDIKVYPPSTRVC